MTGDADPHYPARPPSPCCQAPGDFYTDKDSCLVCDIPLELAPDLLAYAHQDQGPVLMHCFLKMQPSTPEELAQVLEVMRNADTQAIRYRGSDTGILHRLEALGCRGHRDHPLPKPQADGGRLGS